jgi:putative ABC transport system permease protein
MNWIPDRYRELRSRLRPDRVEDDVDEELLLHVELRAADLEATGLTPDAAREEALRRFGNMSDYRAQTCAIDESILRERRRMEVMDAIRRETRYSLRSLLHAPVFTVVAIVTLGLGIGAPTAIFTLIDSIVLRPLPYPEPDELVQITHAVPLVQEGQEWGNSVASYFHYADANGSFDEIGAYSRSTFSVSGDGDAERLDGARVSASLLRVLGARAAHGRLISDDDDLPGVDPVAVISHEIWQSRYAGDVGIVGRTINLNASPVTVIGVLEPGFTLPNHATHFWLPWQLDRAAEAVNSHHVQTYGRLRAGVAPEAAQADLQRLAQNLPELFPGAYGNSWIERSGFSTRVHPLRSVVLGKAAGGRVGIDRVLWLLLGAVSLVLLIACANVANLMLVRGEARRREFAMRSALGAERAHLAVHYLTESMLLAAAAAVLGIAIALAGVQLLVASAPATLPRLGDIGMSGNALVFALALALATGLIFGLVPVMRARTNFGELRESGRGMTASRERQLVRNALVVGQVGMALVLLAAGGLMLKSFVNLRNVQSGVDGENVLTFNVTLPFARYEEEEHIFRFQQEFVERVGALAGVQTVSATSSLPLGGGGGCAYTVGEATSAGGCVPVVIVLPGYFEALGIGVTGRTFTWADLERRADGAVISRALAERLWPGEDPIGRRMISFQDGPPWFTIIGVADDVLADGLDQPPVQAAYYPTRRPDAEGYWGPHGVRSLGFIVKTSMAQPEQLTGAVRGILRELDSEVPLAQVRTMHDVIMSSDKMARTTFTMMLLGIAAVVALFLSAVGLYGVIAYLVGRRRAEIGVRMALGARMSEVARLVVMQSVRLTALGIVIGIGAALVVTRALTSLVWGVEPSDPVTLLGVSVLLLLVAVLASVVPARRAARTDPAEALRAD